MKKPLTQHTPHPHPAHSHHCLFCIPHAKKARVLRHQLCLTCVDLLGFPVLIILFGLDGWWLKYIAVKYSRHLSHPDTHIQVCLALETVFFMCFELLCCSWEKVFFFSVVWCNSAFLWCLYYCLSFSLSPSRHSLNGSLPSNVEIKNNTLFFKGPVTYDLAGTYVCDATNGIGTRTGIVDVNITGRLIKGGCFCVLRLLSNSGMACINTVPCKEKKNVVREHQTPVHPSKHKYPCTRTDQLIAADCLCVFRCGSHLAAVRLPAALCGRLDEEKKKKKKRLCVCVSELHTLWERSSRPPTGSHPALFCIQWMGAV